MKGDLSLPTISLHRRKTGMMFKQLVKNNISSRDLMSDTCFHVNKRLTGPLSKSQMLGIKSVVS